MGMKHTLSVLVENKPGVLARVAELFARRGFNIESLAVGTTEKPDISRMTIVVDVAEHSLEQVRKQLHKLINVIEIVDLDPEASVAREMVMVKVRADTSNRSEIIEITDIFRGNIVDVSRESIIVEVTGNASKLSAFEDLVKPYGIKELVRTGKVALPRGR
ncbi:MAG: acetolactate synthase small subunit [Actinobacteria bacterium]|nr:acetolactate synthase small subunit [Actinomycetota bacterium]MDI6830032.1 acetolactate synthase small subunit [Actinomycetota bacterium]